jgi:hypothetical protein
MKLPGEQGGRKQNCTLTEKVKVPAKAENWQVPLEVTGYLFLTRRQGTRDADNDEQESSSEKDC